MILNLFSEAFLKKHKQVLKENLRTIVGLKESIVFCYPFDSVNWGDIRKVFRHTPEEDQELINYYSKYWDKKATNYSNVCRIAVAVNNRVSYKTDKENYGRIEMWARPIDVHRKCVDDCDGYACLICYVCRLLGMSEDEIFVSVGDVNFTNGKDGGYHAYVVVFDWDSFLYYPIEGSWYPELSISEYSNKEKPLIGHPRYEPPDWMTNDKQSYSTGWFKFVR